MKGKIALLLRYISRFGFGKGMNIFYQNGLKKTGNSKISTKDHTVQLRRGTSDIPTFNHVFVDLSYRLNINFTPKFIIDCGANIGLATVFFKQAYPNAQIVSIEPEKSNYEMLLKNTKEYSNISCINAGVWSKNAILKVEDERGIGNWGFTCREVDKEDDTTVRAVSIRDIMEKYQQEEIDVLKIDIEGSEKELFSSNYEYWLPRTKVLVIEIHDWLMKGSSKAFFSAMIQYDFSTYYAGEDIVCIRN